MVSIVSTMTLDRVSGALDELCTDQCDATREENLSLIRELGQPGKVSEVLREVIGDPKLLGHIAGRSYHQPNHFDKIVLVDSGQEPGYRLTLHLWAPPYSEAEAIDEKIHDHRFNFWSSILVGHLHSQNYVRDATGETYGEYHYIPERRDISTVCNFFVPAGEAQLLETQPSSVEAGTSYHLAFYRIHRVILPRTNMTCTLVLRGPRHRDHSSVFSTSGRYDPSESVMFLPDALADKLSALLREIERTRI